MTVKRYEVQFDEVNGGWTVDEDTPQHIDFKYFDEKEEAVEFALDKCREQQVELVVYDQLGSIEWSILHNDMDGSQQLLVRQTEGLPPEIRAYAGQTLEVHNRLQPHTRVQY